MALTVCKANLLSPPLSLSSSSSSPLAAGGATSNWRYPVVSLSNLRSLRTRLCCTASRASQQKAQRDGRPRFKDFPYASAPLRDLMVEVVSMVESRLATQLVRRILPPDVEYYTNERETNHGSLYLVTGARSSPIEFILGSWQYWEFPRGGSGNSINFTCFMKRSTDAPSLTINFVQYSPTLLRFTIDLPPRKELAISHEYVSTFYLDTMLDKPWQFIVQSIPEAFDYTPPSINVRCTYSPTAIMVCIDTSESDGGGETRLKEILTEQVRDAAKKVVETWLEVCACGKGRKVTNALDKDSLKARDRLLINTVIEVDIGSGMESKFGHETTLRILGPLRALPLARN